MRVGVDVALVTLTCAVLLGLVGGGLLLRSSSLSCVCVDYFFLGFLSSFNLVSIHL